MALSAIILAAAVAAAPDSATQTAGDAVTLYDEGRYAEAGEMLRYMDQSKALDGPLLYRLFFCERAAGNEAAAQEALGRARKALEAENVAGAPLEISFYLANTLSNQSLPDEARKVAEAATRSVESKARPEPATAIGAFQMGKLYQDQVRQADAVRWYKRAIEGFDPKGPRYGGPLRWSLRYVGNAAYARGEFGASEEAFAKLTGLGDAGAGDWNALASSRARLGQLAPAADAWRKSVSIDPQNGDDARYAGRIALVASQIGPLPLADAAGKTFATMTPAEIEGAMKTEADAARVVHEKAAAAPPPDAKALEGLKSELAAIKGRFFAASLEYALRRLPIRETAFREGYAVLVFQDTEWAL